MFTGVKLSEVKRSEVNPIFLEVLRKETSVEAIGAVAEIVFRDLKENGFDRRRSLAYNMLVSARCYLKTGAPLMGGSRADELML
jgi:hypothetical protein